MATKNYAPPNRKPFQGGPKKFYGKTKVNTTRERHNGDPSNNNDDNKDDGVKIWEDRKPSKDDNNKMRINRNARLIVRNVSFKATEETLREHFEPYGQLIDLNLLKKPDGKLVGCAFVHYKNVPMAKNAILQTNMKPFLGRPISVDWAVAKNKYMQHKVEQELQMQDDVKKEDSDSDNDIDTGPINISNDDLKAEVKSESGDSGDDSIKSEDDSDDSGSGSDDEDGSDEGNEEDDDEDEEQDVDMKEEDAMSETSTVAERKRVQLNDAEDGCTAFLTNIPFSVDNEQLKSFAEKTGPVKYALICVDKLTEHSKGSGFVKFVNKEDADKFLQLPASELKLEGQVIQVKPALKRENLQTGSKKQPKDNRNLYLVKEGVVVAGTKAAVGVSASDMAKRLALERSKTQMLKNLNRFVSRYRLVVSNLPPQWEDGALRRLCQGVAGKDARITEARVMRDLRAPVGKDGRHPSKGYGFVMFMRHEDALTCLRKLNNNPEVFDKNNRPIVSFSIEDRTALNARKKRLEKSIANNPTANKNKNEDYGLMRKRKRNERPDESTRKRGKFDRRNQKQNGGQDGTGKFVKLKREDNFGEYTGLTAKEGAQHKMRSNRKLKMQADVHRQTVKQEKKQSKRTQRLKMAAKERIKQPKQRVNKNQNKNYRDPDRKVKAVLKETNTFSDLVSKYKSKLAGNSLDRVKAKWYES